MSTRRHDRLPWVAPALIPAAIAVWLIVLICIEGVPHLSWTFLTSGPIDGGRGGGIAPMIVSTVILLVLALALAIPIALPLAIWYRATDHTALRQWYDTMIDSLAAVPSICWGLAGYVLLVNIAGFGFSLLAGGLTLGAMILPLLARLWADTLCDIPDGQVEAGRALGLSPTRQALTIWLPAVRRSLFSGALIAVARAVAETAALIFTSGYASRMPEHLFDSGRALSVHILDLAMNVPGGNGPAAGTALLSLLVVAGAGTLTRSQRRPRAGVELS